MAPITASAPCTMAMTNATAMRPVRERASTTTTLASANERLLLAAYIALTCASPDDDSAATEKATLVNALPMVTNAQSQNKRDFIRRITCGHQIAGSCSRALQWPSETKLSYG